MPVRAHSGRQEAVFAVSLETGGLPVSRLTANRPKHRHIEIRMTSSKTRPAKNVHKFLNRAVHAAKPKDLLYIRLWICIGRDILMC